jgi:hypothetical protein
MAAVDDNAHYTNRFAPRTVQNTLAVPIFALYFQHTRLSFTLMKEAVGSPRKFSTFVLGYTALHVNTDSELTVKKEHSIPYNFPPFISIFSQTESCSKCKAKCKATRHEGT